ncbi:MAG: 30S ribosomal protein S12 methylthiotransferase RimO [Treponema sp.]|jgi:ribosomal protein S12 methylthiotransferase|nr:30S ribosomal protein S12 methylthiotransferase RimO [Treponema sp.]
MYYFLDPFGCVKNQVDAENMMAHLNNAGWEIAPDAENANLIIVNSCGFIESAKKESINAVLNWRKLYPEKKILLAGCLSQRYANELAETLPETDGFFGVDDISRIVEKVELITGNRGLPPQKNSDTFSRPLLSLPGSAYVKISEGCDNRCSFCAIPLIRGGLHCRTIPEILAECKGLLDRDIRELCIIGQDIGSYHSANGDYSANGGLPELLGAISTLKGKGQFWVRLLYIHPDHFPLPILDIMEKDARFLPYFDIPFQHASAKILAAMNRRGTAESHLALVETIRRRLPRAVIRSTFLLGFPGETEEDFASLLDFQEKARLDWLGCFAYSREEDTAAYSMQAQVPKKTAARRKQIIEERQIPISEKNMDRFAGQTVDVLIEEKFGSNADNAISSDSTLSENNEIYWLGRLYCQAPDIDGAAVIVSNDAENANLTPGTFVSCKVIARRGIDLLVSNNVL